MTRKVGIIAIDGQAAAGKSTVGRELARRLEVPFLDTGIMYRAITWLALRESAAMDDETGLGNMTRGCTMRLTGTEGNAILVDDTLLGPELRSAQVDDHVSLLARVPSVRRELVRQQRDIAAQSAREWGGIVMVGRDIGTVVLPDADLKVFLVAKPEVRAQRRYDELVCQGQEADYQRILANALSRDRIDSERDDSPLAQASDAMVLDSSNLTVDQVVERALEGLGARPGSRMGGAAP